MNPNIRLLSTVLQKKTKCILGLMSGTSLDGLDMALCEISGQDLQTKVVLKYFNTVSYSRKIKNAIKEVFARKNISLEKLTLLHAELGTWHAEMILDQLKSWKVSLKNVDCIASHGQTVYHAPKYLSNKEKHATLQIGDADHIAFQTGCLTVSDFRQKHIAAGGEGAPLAVYGDYLLFSSEAENRVLLNIGGISNYTYLHRSRDADKVLYGDIGPGNTLIDAFVQHHYQLEYDQEGRLGKEGKTNLALLEALKYHSFFQNKESLSTGQELFNLSYVHDAQKLSQTEGLPLNDVLSTLYTFTVDLIAERLAKLSRPFTLYLSGGGAYNPLIKSMLKEKIQEKTYSFDKLGIPASAKEAVIFAVLANQTLGGEDKYFINHTSLPDVFFGKLSFPF